MVEGRAGDIVGNKQQADNRSPNLGEEGV